MKAKTLQFGKALRVALFVLMLGAAGMTKAYADGFVSVSPSGHGIRYEIINADLKTVRTVRYYVNDHPYSYQGSVIIPSSVVYQNDTYTVIEIGSNTFKDQSLMTSVDIPNTVTTIGWQAFYNCTGLTGTLTIGESVVSVNSGAFSHTNYSVLNYNAIRMCTNEYGDVCNYSAPGPNHGDEENGWLGYCPLLTTLNIGEQVQVLPSNVFSYCKFSGQLILPDSLTVIGNYAFYGCQQLSGTLSIPEKVRKIGKSAFYGCEGLTELVFNATDFQGSTSCYDTSFPGLYGENETFGACPLLKTLLIGEEVSTITTSLFKNCYFEEAVVIPNSVTTIGNQAFSGCTGITELTIGEGVTSIGVSAFKECTNLETVYYNAISCNYANSSSYPFDNCPSLTTLIIGDEVETLPNNAFKSCSFAGEIVIPNSVTEIGSSAFYGCTNITSVTIGEGVTRTTGQMFRDCTNLTSVTYNAVNCTNWSSYYIWDGCTSLTTLTIGPNVQYLPGRIFEGCSFTGELTLPNSLVTIGEKAFNGCSGFTGDLIIPDNVTTIGGNAFNGCTGFTGDLTIGDAVETIGEYAFANCSGLTGALTIGESFNHFEGTWGKAFDNCSNLTVLNYNAINATLGGGYWLNNCTSLTTLNIGPNVQVIPENAFLGLNFSNDIVIPNAVTTIEYHAFHNCDSITSITIGEGVTTLASWAIEDCDNLAVVNYNAVNCNVGNTSVGRTWLGNSNPSLTTLNIGEHVQSIFKGAFRDRPFTNNLVLPNSLESIGEEAFYHCTGFTGSLVIPNSVTSIGKNAFYQCTGFTGDLVIGDGVTTIEEKTFYQCSGFTGTLTLGSSIETIGREAFKECSGFTGDLTIPDSVTTLGWCCFYGCSGFDGALTVGESVTTIDSGPFNYCSGLTALNYNAINVTNIPSSWIGNCNALTTLTIGENVQTIFEKAFENHPSFTGDLVIPNSVVSIGNCAFKNCSGFTGTLDLGSFVETIGEEAFHDCTGFTGSLILPDSLTAIGNKAFRNCHSFTGDLVIPNSVETIGNDAFWDCYGMDGSLTIGVFVTSIGANSFRYTKFHTLNYNAINATLTDNSWLNDCNLLTTLNIGDQVQVIPNYAFKNRNRFTGNLVLPNSLVTIEKEAFYGDHNFTGDLVIPNNVTSIGDHAFSNCDGFNGTLSLSNTLETIGEYAFDGCKNMTGSLTLPNSIDTIGIYAFSNCYGFNGTLQLPDGLNTIEKRAFNNCRGFIGDLVIPNSVTIIKEGAFQDCYGFDGTLTLSDSLSTIEKEAFRNCNKLKGYLVIPNSVVSIGNSVFYSCNGFDRTLIIGNSVDTIGNYAFENCRNFQSMKTKNVTPPGITGNTFNNWDKTKPVYIPCGTYAAYSSANYWSDFSNFQEQIASDIFVYSSNPSFGTVSVTQQPTCDDSEAVVTAFPNDGYALGNWTENGEVVSTENPYTFNLTGDRILIANFYCEISTAYSPVQGGTVAGAGAYAVGDTCTLTAYPAEDFEFVQWREEGVTVSTEASYSFQVTGPREIVAVFSAIGRLPGLLYGKFSVGENTQVCFSQGNLQYIGSSPSPYWKFADNQWDYFGTSQGSSDEDIDRDLFGWGTSGYNHGATCYQPWSTNTSNDNYYAYGSPDYDLHDQTGQADWGFNAISNGGNQENYWRSLTKDEWTYLLNTRVTNSGIRWAKAIVNNVNGMVLLPDNWSDSIYHLNNVNGGNYGNNVISITDWIGILEANGAVFLPAVGYRPGTSVGYSGNNGDYWTTTKNNNNNAYHVNFNSYNYSPAMSSPRHQGRSVRLAKTLSSLIQATVNPVEGGTVTGAGTYVEGTTCTLTATANEGFIFLNWTEDNEVISNDAVYSFIVSGDRCLVANFVEGEYSCDIIFNLSSDWDSWDNYLVVTDENGIPQYLLFDGEESIYTLSFLTGSHVTLTLISGEYPEGCSCTVSYANGNLIYHGENLNENFNYGFDADCNTAPVGNIVFADPLVKSICVSHWDTSGDGELNYTEAAMVTSIGIVFTQEAIISFNELQYFTALTSLEPRAFYNCSSLTSITIPNNVASIDSIAFSGCSSMNSITVLAETPPTLGSRAFRGVPIGIPVHVPCGTLGAYQSASGWNSFTNFQEDCGQIVTQTIDLETGWNWISTYIEVDNPIAMLQMVETGLGGYGVQIKNSQVNTEYDSEWGWFGDLDDVGMTNEQMYAINVSAPCTVTVEGTPANPSNHPITIVHGWNWIGFPSGVAISLEDAFAGFAQEGDKIKNRVTQIEYDPEWGWFGDFETLEPGQGYMYYSSRNTPRTLVFPVGAK